MMMLNQAQSNGSDSASAGIGGASSGIRGLATCALVALVVAPGAAAAQASSAPQAPASSQGQPSSQPPAEETPGQPGQTIEPAEVEPVGPVQPVRTFDPVPLPGELGQAAPATPPAAPPALQTAPITAGSVQGGTAAPIVPGAAEAGFVVPDNRSLYGRDFLPAVGASVIAAAGFRASVGFRISHDSNVLRLPSDVEAPEGSGVSRGDWILRPDLNLGIGRNFGQQLFFLNADLGYDFFVRNEGRSQGNSSLNGGMEWRLGASCGGRVQGGWSTRETGGQGFVVGIPGTTRNTDFFFNGTCNSGSGFVPSINFAAGQVRFDPDFREVSNADYWSIGGSLGYQLSPTTQVGVQVNQQNSSFPNQPLRPIEDPDGQVISLSALSISGFASYLINTSLNANVTIGWTKSNNNDPLFEDFSGLTGNISLAYAGPRYGLAFNFGRDVNLGNTEGANLRIRSTIGLTGNYRMNEQLTLATGFSFDRDNNRGDIRFGSPVNLIDQDFWRAFANANYRMSERLSFNLGYRYESRVEQVVELEGLPDLVRPGYTSHIVEFGLRFQFR